MPRAHVQILRGSYRALKRPHSERLAGQCRLLVVFSTSRKPTLERRMAMKCAEVATVSRPFCSMAELFEKKGKALTKLFKPNSRISAHYSAREFNFTVRQGWSITVDNKKTVRSQGCR